MGWKELAVGFQFVHTETYSRKGSKGRSTDYVFDEAERAVQLPHIEVPGEVEVVYGMGVDQVRRLHDMTAAEARCVTQAGQVRKVRNDQHTLVTVVMSHPALRADIDADPDLAEEVELWEQKNVEWLRSIYGDQLVSVLRHTDEPHAHLHAYVIPSTPDMRAKELHPGYVAKAEAMQASLAEGNDVKVANRAGDLAFRQAMREYQDSYFEAVAIPCGLTRLGPGRRRLPQAGWRAEQASMKATAKAIRASDVASVNAAHAEAEANEAKRVRAVALEQAKAVKKGADEFKDKVRKWAKNKQKEANSLIKTAEMREERSRSIGGIFHAVLEGVRGKPMEAKFREEIEEIKQTASIREDRLKGELEFQKALNKDLERKALRDFTQDSTVTDEEVERRARQLAEQMVRDRLNGNDVGPGYGS